MKKIRLIILISILILCWYFKSIGFYGTFYDGTGARDTVWMNVATFDTLGQQTNADSVWFIRHYRTTAIDTVIMSTATAGTGYYITGKRAFDGTNYGDYTVRIRWKSQTKYFGKTESYTVFPSDTSNIKTMLTNNSFAQIGTDKIWRLRGLAIRGTSGDDTAFIAQGYGYGMGVLAGGGSAGFQLF